MIRPDTIGSIQYSSEEGNHNNTARISRPTIV